MILPKYASKGAASGQLWQREEDFGKLLANSRLWYCRSMPPRAQLLVNCCGVRRILANFWQTQDYDIAVVCLKGAASGQLLQPEEDFGKLLANSRL